VLIVAALVALSAPARAQCPQAETTKIIPLPVWSTSPNEGTTWGVMPIFIRICPHDQRTQWLLAPSVTHNEIIEYSATIRFFAYPDRDTTLTLIGSAATRINYRVVGMRQHLPHGDGEFTDDTYLRIERNAFARFYGLGDDSMASGESTYTAEHAIASERRGVNIGDVLNFGVTFGFDREVVDPMGVMGLPLTTDAYPNVPGVQSPSVIGYQGVDLRYDDRKGGDYAETGVRIDANLSINEGFAGSPSFIKGGLQARSLFPEIGWLSGAARIAYTGMSASDAPFYLQSTLGGPHFLRGFAEGRFYATQAWTAELEQRIRFLRTRLFNVVADWRIDPFVAVGQVFDHPSDIVANTQLSVGAGMRIFVHPNILARVDFADGGEGIKIYVELGYPY
jgi:hypothetical protein